MNPIVSLMAAGAKKRFSREEYGKIRGEADTLFRKLAAENRDCSRALKRHTETNIFPAIAVYKTLLAHGMAADDAVDVIRKFFCKVCGIMFRPAAWYQHIAGNYHRYPSGMVKHSLRDFSPEAGFEYRLPEKTDPAVARFDIVSCPYHAMCEKYGCTELNPAFCDCDDAKYGNLHRNLKWARRSTIGYGAPRCDFRIIDVSRRPDYEEPQGGYDNAIR